MSRKEQLEAFGQLLDIMDELREKCPWDRKQTFESLRIQTIEETYELTEAIIDNNMDEVKKELGDLLLHIVFYAKMGTTETQRERPQTDGAVGCAEIAASASESLSHSGQNPQHRVRLGRPRASMGKG